MLAQEVAWLKRTRLTASSIFLRESSSKYLHMLSMMGDATSPSTFQTQRFPELRFSATLGQEPEVELALV